MIFLQTQFDPTHSVEIAKGISEFGFMAITTAFYLIVTAIFFISTVIGNKTTLKEILKLEQQMITMLGTVVDSLKDETLEQVKQYGRSSIDNCKYILVFEIDKIKSENNIEDRDHVLKKVYSLVQNLHDSRNSTFELFSYKGKPLTFYSDANWVEKVSKASMDCIYAKKYSLQKSLDELTIIFNEILNDFYKNMQK